MREAIGPQRYPGILPLSKLEHDPPMMMVESTYLLITRFERFETFLFLYNFNVHKA